MCGYVCVHAHVSIVSINSVVLILGVHTLFTQQSVVLFCFLDTQNHHGMIQCSGSVQCPAQLFTEYGTAFAAPEKIWMK